MMFLQREETDAEFSVVLQRQLKEETESRVLLLVSGGAGAAQFMLKGTFHNTFLTGISTAQKNPTSEVSARTARYLLKLFYGIRICYIFSSQAQ